MSSRLLHFFFGVRLVVVIVAILLIITIRHLIAIFNWTWIKRFVSVIGIPLK